MTDVIDSSAKEYLNQFMARIERLEEDKRVILNMLFFMYSSDEQYQSQYE